MGGFTMKNSYMTDGQDVWIKVETNTSTLIAIVEHEDLELLKSFDCRWCATWKESSKSYYIVGKDENKKVIYLHRFLMKIKNEMQVDHINGNTQDNRRVNLRILTNGENKQNKTKAHSQNKSGYRGVRYHKDSNKWHATITVNKKTINLGLFSDIEEANKAAQYARAHYMPFSAEALTKDSFEFVSKPENQHTLNSKSGVKGVKWETRRKRWLAEVRINKKPKYLGAYGTIEEAAEAIQAYKLAIKNTEQP